eukprot:GILK01005804.1.p1 GENE.GILK01005804.1~~GILK01005804.1.p1  ORF type:complete len:248 (+),score=24.35 GILK01005804.1:41-745(+)
MALISQGEVDLSQYHDNQVLSLNEELIMVNEDDVPQPVVASKKQAHLMQYLNNGGLPHRAFSVLLFNSKGQLLLQQRSDDKITFARNWANSCCSHPWSSPEEMEPHNQLGVKRAAIRRLKHELNIEGLCEDDLTCVGRILYKASSDGLWGEYEVDYILIAQKDIAVGRNPEEVADIAWVSRNEIQSFLKDKATKAEPTSPWFKLLVEHSLDRWWEAIEQGNLTNVIDLNIRRWT